MDPVKQAAELKAAASQLLDEMHIITLLERYGQVETTGSYKFGVMTWRDIDLCVAVPEPTTLLLFDMGKEIAGLPHVGSMYFRNEYVLRTPGNPVAMFWTVDVFPPGGKKWKLDVLVATHGEVRRVLAIGEELLHGIDDAKRASILAIKSVLGKSTGYRVSFRSTDIYEAVMKDGVVDLRGWKSWWKRKKSQQ
jgi:hypothetical protein